MTDGATQLLEREDDLAVLSAALGERGRVVLIEGPAGIGKTRLLDAMRERAGAIGAQALSARGGELERGYGFGVARQLLEATVSRAPPDERAELLSGAAQLAEPVFAAPASPSPSGSDTTQSVLHGLYWLVANLAERAPLLLAVDDVQWADEPSLRFLVYLARRLEGVPVTLALALRTGEPGTEAELLRALRLEAQPPVLAPRALSEDATLTLTAARLGRPLPAGVGRACHDATRGNPFLLTELLVQLRGAGEEPDPAAIGQMVSERAAAAILLRVGRAGARALALARATSVLGDAADLDTAAALAGLDGAAAAGLVDALVRAQVLEAAAAPPSPLRFVHPLVRAAVYEDMPRDDRARLHGQAARRIAGRAGGGDAAARQLLLAEPTGDEDTVAMLREAARAALARGAPETAAAFLRRAEREPPPEAVRPAVLLELGIAAARAGHADGVDLLREAFRLARGQPGKGRAGLELGFALGVSRSPAEAIAVLDEARDGLEDGDLRTALDARLLMFAISVPAARARLSAHVATARAAIGAPPADGPLELLGPLSADLLYTPATAAEVAALAEQALVGGTLTRRDIATESDFALGALTALLCTGRLRSAEHHLDDAIAHAGARGSPFAMARICAFRALVRWQLGELPGAASDAQAALAVDAAWGIPHALSAAALARVQIERGELVAARATLDGLDPDPALLEVVPSQVVREARAALAMARGRPREALAVLEEYARWEQGAGIGDGVVTIAWRSAAALAHLQLGEIDEARELAARELELARTFGAPLQLGAALRALAIVTGGSDGVPLLEEAVGVLDAASARVEQARALIDLGALLRRGGRRSAASDALRAGMDLADRCSATVLVEAAAAELRQAGARPRRIALSGRASLTPSELRVTDLAAQRMSNKQIAQALFVTLRTVEMHLSNGYRKLGITSREELAAALGAD